MNLNSLFESKRELVVIYDTEIYFKVLNLKEFKEFEIEHTKFVNTESDGEKTASDSVMSFCKYLLDNYITDKDGEPIISDSDFLRLPVRFCVKVIQKYVEFASGASDEDIKKK